jgi:uncharacterized protein (DUF169 family)
MVKVKITWVVRPVARSFVKSENKLSKNISTAYKVIHICTVFENVIRGKVCTNRTRKGGEQVVGKRRSGVFLGSPGVFFLARPFLFETIDPKIK